MPYTKINLRLIIYMNVKDGTIKSLDIQEKYFYDIKVNNSF